jgi:hypothetical protein
MRLKMTLGVLLVAATAEGAVPPVYFQGFLRDSTGQPAADNVYAFRFRLYRDSTGGTAIWESADYVTLRTSGGSYAYALGSTEPLPVWLCGYEQVWLGVAVGLGTELRPRAQVTVPPCTNEPETPPATMTQPAPVEPTSQPDSMVQTTSQAQTASLALSTPERKGFPWFYAHVGMGLGVGKVSSRDYKTLLDPLKPRPLSAGYSIGLIAGIRNIYQFEFRPRAVTTQAIYYSEGGTDIAAIPMTVHFRNEFIHKLNLLFFRSRLSADESAPCLFVSFGHSSDGKIRHVDENNDGFMGGKERIFGVEFGKLGKNLEVTILVEQHQVEFERFRIAGFGELVGVIKADFWFVGMRMAGGIGF